MIVLAGCTPISTQNPTPPPTEFIHVHSYFSGYAFLDANGKGDLDADDTPVANTTFIVTLQGGTEFGDQTDETGYAFITIPADVEYPVTVRMEVPKDSGLKLIGPSEVIFTSGDESPKFLFISE